MNYRIVVTDDADQDLEELVSYIAQHDGVEAAIHVWDEIMSSVSTLTRYPERGSVVKETVGLSTHTYRELFWTNYRVIYRVEDDRVILFMVTDGRRNVQELIMERFR